MARRKLGRGLDMLIPPAAGGTGEAATAAVAPPVQEVLQLDPGEIERNPHQPRKAFPAEELEALKASVEREGVLQPLLVRRHGQKYQLVAGERRLKACQELGLEKVPALVVDLPDERLLQVALVENIHRADLNPIELALAYKRLMEVREWTQEALADELGMSRPVIANTVRLLELPADMREALTRRQIQMGHAKVLLSVADSRAQRGLFERLVRDGLSVRELERARDEGQEEPREPPGPQGGGGDGPGRRRRPAGGSGKKPYLVALEEELSEALSTKVRITERGGRGVLAIEFYSREDFDRLRRLLAGRDRE